MRAKALNNLLKRKFSNTCKHVHTSACKHSHSHGVHTTACKQSHNHGHQKSSLSSTTKTEQKVTPCRHGVAADAGVDFLGEENTGVFEVESSRIKYGPHALREVGNAAKFIGCKRAVVYTDRRLRHFEYVDTVVKSLEANGIETIIYDEVLVEPTDVSFKEASRFAMETNPDCIVSVGGGSVIDTAKAANLYSSYPVEDFLDYVNPPIGKGKTPPGPLKTHIACPTTSGTGSESTGLAIFDLLSMHAKTGLAMRAIKPSMAVIDPLVTATLPRNVTAASAFDVLSHAVESFTACPHNMRKPAASSNHRPMSQGQNLYADIGCLEALRLLGRYMERAVWDPSDEEARHNLMFASTLAGIAFGNVGCHLPHGMSYPVAGNVRSFQPDGYPDDQPICPHGMAVMVNAPSVFRFTAKASPERHMRAAEALGADIRTAHLDDAGEVLSGRMIELMKMTQFPNGLQGVGYDMNDLDTLVNGAWPQQRLLANAPLKIHQEDLHYMYTNAMSYW